MLINANDYSNLLEDIFLHELVSISKNRIILFYFHPTNMFYAVQLKIVSIYWCVLLIKFILT